MYAVHTRHVVDQATKKYPVLIETKHLVQKFEVVALTSLDSDEDSFGNVSHSVETITRFTVTALCGAEFPTFEISMFGDADLCATCAEAFKKLPRYIR